MTQTPSEPLQTAGKATSALENGQAAHRVVMPDLIAPQTDWTLTTAEIEPPPIKRVEPDVETLQPRQGFRWWRGISIRTKATTLAIVLGTVPMLTIAGIAYSIAGRALTERAGISEREQAIALQSQVNQFMRGRFSDIQVMAQLDIFTDPQLRSAISNAAKAAALTRILNSHKIYDIAAVTDLKGNLIAQTAGEPLGNLSNRTYIRAALQANGPILSQPVVSPTSGIFSIYAASVIKDKLTKQPIGIVFTRMPVKVLEEVIKNYRDSGNKYYLVDGSGKVFIGPEGEYVNQMLSTGAAATGRQDTYTAIAPEEIFPALAGKRLENQPITVQSQNTKTQTEALLAYTPPVQMSGLPDLNWTAIIAIDTSIAFAAQRKLLVVFTLATGVITLLLSAIAADIANRATRPIRSAATAVQKIGQGDLDTRLEVKGEDELGVLGENINSMAAQLQTSLTAQALEVTKERVLTAAKGSGVLGQAELKIVFDQSVADARDWLGVDRVVIYRFDAGLDRGVVSESVDGNWPSALENNVNDTCIPQSLREAYLNGRVIANRDVSIAELDWHPEHVRLMERLQIKSNLVVPITGGGQLYGLLIAHMCSAMRDWQPVEIDFLRRLGNELGLSIYRVELLEQTTNLAQEQRQLKEELQKRALELLQEVDPISRGDLTTRAKVTADEIGTIADSYNATVDNLRKIVVQVQTAANQVVSTTTVNETSIQALTSEALRQTEEISIALELVKQMADTVQTVAANAEQAETAVQQAAQTVEEGDEVMNRTVEGIQVIRVTVADTAKKVKHLGESSQKISKVVELISAFAAQTNMLALNASIEASRAGEEGRGFAVVANEVRVLARQSAEATEEIRGLISSIQAETNEVVAAMESGIEQVVTGTKLVDETRQSLNKITAVSAQISALVEAIAQSTVIQSQASETVTRTMQGVAAIANKTSTEVGHVSSSFEELRQVAETLQAGVGQFKV
jgi:methyl-accepting chemotaxis protein PixJ